MIDKLAFRKFGTDTSHLLKVFPLLPDCKLREFHSSKSSRKHQPHKPEIAVALSTSNSASSFEPHNARVIVTMQTLKAIVGKILSSRDEKIVGVCKKLRGIMARI
ncbi:uncharacterized protein L3040_000429 [Drepanopeziza brunnea f. sp. 'multigermtubi']|uniref:uncharacterized protein n=1 Tax=Drepanopeziza brunnea f. sp. 'multigermtubi' TaxID=698441 RepID=UPI00239F68C0|nr:hypothetical protein L3040_000429 [Drepanopeziza brunnea f. sp. 'multigermtubi']